MRSAYWDIKKHADSLRKAGHFTQALEAYRQLWEQHRNFCNIWDGWAYAHCLKKCKHYYQALDVARQVYQMDTNFKPIKSLYAWCVYYTEIASQPVSDEPRFLKAAEAIVSLTDKNDTYAPYSLTVLKVLQYLSHKKIFPAESILRWTALLDPRQLDDHPFSVLSADGKLRELASNREQYYMGHTKALFALGKYQECIDACQEALSNLSAFHYDNHIWFKRRMALALYKTDQKEQAASHLSELLKKRDEWFLHKDLADILQQTGSSEKALRHYAEACLHDGDLKLKVGLYMNFIKALRQSGRYQDAEILSESFTAWCNLKGIALQNTSIQIENKPNLPTSSAPTRSPREAINDLCLRIKFEGQPSLTGIIHKILPGNKAGFIRADNRELYYFRLKNFNGKSNMAQVGCRVSFFITEAYDEKKQKDSWQAVHIVPVLNDCMPSNTVNRGSK